MLQYIDCKILSICPKKGSQTSHFALKRTNPSAHKYNILRDACGNVLSLVTAPRPVSASEFGLTRRGGSPRPRCRLVVCQGGGRCVQVRGAVEPSPGADARDSGDLG